VHNGFILRSTAITDVVAFIEYYQQPFLFFVNVMVGRVGNELRIRCNNNQIVVPFREVNTQYVLCEVRKESGIVIQIIVFLP
jgi:hypothetical protein